MSRILGIDVLSSDRSEVRIEDSEGESFASGPGSLAVNMSGEALTFGEFTAAIDAVCAQQPARAPTIMLHRNQAALLVYAHNLGVPCDSTHNYAAAVAAAAEHVTREEAQALADETKRWCREKERKRARRVRRRKHGWR